MVGARADEEGAGEAVRAAKRLLRAQVLAARDRMDPALRDAGSRDVCRRLAGWELLRKARTLALYRAFGSELTLAPLVRELAALPPDRRPQLLAPAVLGPRRMAFLTVDPHELLDPAATPDFLRHPGRIGAPEDAGALGRAGDSAPAGGGAPAVGRKRVEADRIDLALVPAVALGADCRRLGHGGGFYDAFLSGSGFAGVSCGVAFDQQVLPAGQVPCEPFDAPVDMVVTTDACYGLACGATPPPPPYAM